MNIVKYSYKVMLCGSENESMMSCIGMHKSPLCNWKKRVPEKYTQYGPISVHFKNVTHGT